MATVSEYLRSGRESLGMTIYQVAEVTKIKTDHVRALEDGDYNVFAAPVYIRGFVRTYSRLLKLDESEVLSALDSELGRTERFGVPPSFSPPAGGFLDAVMLQLSKVNWTIALPTIAIIVVILFVVFGYRAWQNHQARDPLSDLGPGLYQPTQPSQGELLPLPPVQPKD